MHLHRLRLRPARRQSGTALKPAARGRRKNFRAFIYSSSRTNISNPKGWPSEREFSIASPA